MKNIIILSIILGLCNYAYSQENGFYNNNQQITKPIEQKYHVFFGAGIGINNSCGLIGTLVEYAPVKKLSILGGIGIGSWGVKTALGIRYYNRGFPRKLFYGLTFTSAGGYQNHEMELETTTLDKQTVELNFNRANNLALTIGYQWMLFRNGRLNFEAGYSLALQNKAYEVLTPGIELSENSKSTLQIMTPGGIVIGLAFTIGF